MYHVDLYAIMLECDGLNSLLIDRTTSDDFQADVQIWNLIKHAAPKAVLKEAKASPFRLWTIFHEGDGQKLHCKSATSEENVLNGRSCRTKYGISTPPKLHAVLWPVLSGVKNTIDIVTIRNELSQAVRFCHLRNSNLTSFLFFIWKNYFFPKFCAHVDVYFS